MWLEATSGNLAVRRGPAFYFESECQEAEAREGVSEAEKVMEFRMEFLRKLRGS